MPRYAHLVMESPEICTCGAIELSHAAATHALYGFASAQTIFGEYEPLSRETRQRRLDIGLGMVKLERAVSPPRWPADLTQERQGHPCTSENV